MQAMLSCVPVKTKNNSMVFFLFSCRLVLFASRSFECKRKVSWRVHRNHMKGKKIFIRSRRVHESLLIHLKKAQTVDARQVFSLVWFIEVKSRKENSR